MLDYTSFCWLGMEMGRLNNLGDRTGAGGDRGLEAILPGNGKGGDAGDGKSMPVEKDAPKKKKRTKKKSSVLQVKLNHLAGVIGQIGKSMIIEFHLNYI